MRNHRRFVLLLLGLVCDATAKRIRNDLDRREFAAEHTVGRASLHQDGDAMISHVEEGEESTGDAHIGAVGKTSVQPRFDKKDSKRITNQVMNFLADWLPATRPSIATNHASSFASFSAAPLSETGKVPVLKELLEHHTLLGERLSFAEEVMLQALRCAEDSHNLGDGLTFSKRYQPRTPSNDKHANPYYIKRFVNAYKWQVGSKWEWAGFLTKFIPRGSTTWEKHGIAVLALHGTRTRSDYDVDRKIAASQSALDAFANQILCQAGIDLFDLQKELDPVGVQNRVVTKPLKLFIVGHSLGGIIAIKIADNIARNAFPKHCRNTLPSGDSHDAIDQANYAIFKLKSVDNGAVNVKVLTLGSPISVPQDQITSMTSKGIFLGFRANAYSTEEINVPDKSEPTPWWKEWYPSKILSNLYDYDVIPEWSTSNGNLRKCSLVGEHCIQLHFDTCQDTKGLMPCHALQTFYSPAIRDAFFNDPWASPDSAY